jgi:hypothetical protein
MATKNNSSKYTEDWIPIKNIKDGMVLLEGNYYVTGVRIEPRNIFILDYQEQNNVIFNLRTFYNSIDFSAQFCYNGVIKNQIAADRTECAVRRDKRQTRKVRKYIW